MFFRFSAYMKNIAELVFLLLDLIFASISSSALNFPFSLCLLQSDHALFAVFHLLSLDVAQHFDFSLASRRTDRCILAKSTKC